MPKNVIVRYPSPTRWCDVEAERLITVLQAVIVAARELRTESKNALSKSIALELAFENVEQNLREFLEENSMTIARMSKFSSARTRCTDDDPLTDDSASIAVVTPDGTIVVTLVGLAPLDPIAVRDRMTRDLAVAEKTLELAQMKLANANFIAKAPATVVAEARERERAASSEVERLRAALIDTREPQS